MLKLKIEEIEKNNELFANSLTLKIIGREKFVEILKLGGFESEYIESYTQVIEKFLKDFEENVENHLIKTKI